MRERIESNSQEAASQKIAAAGEQFYEAFRNHAENCSITELFNGAVELGAAAHSPASYKLNLLLDILPDGATAEQRQAVEEYLDECYGDAVVDGLTERLNRLATSGQLADEISEHDLRRLGKLVPSGSCFSGALERLIDQHRIISIEATVDEAAQQHATVHRQVFGALANGKAASKYGLPTIDHFEKLMEYAADQADEMEDNPRSFEQFLTDNPEMQAIETQAEDFRDKLTSKYQRFDKAPRVYREQYLQAKEVTKAAYQRELAAPQAAIDSINTMMEAAGLGRFEFEEPAQPVEELAEVSPIINQDHVPEKSSPSSARRRLILYGGAASVATVSVLSPQAASASEHQVVQQDDSYIDGSSPVIISVGKHEQLDSAEEYIEINSDDVIEDEIALMSSNKDHLRKASVIKRELQNKYGPESGRLAAHELSHIGNEFGGHRLQQDAAQAMRLMSAAFEKEFGYPIGMTDSYRSFAAQVDCRQEKGSACAVPGTSNHGWGMAADIGEHGVNDFNSPQHQWLRKHAHRFGWELPEWARENGSKPEPWHWEYVGGVSLKDGAGDDRGDKREKHHKPEKLSQKEIIDRALDGLEKRSDGAFKQRAQAMRFFMNRGLTAYQAAGIIGNFTVESADEDLNPAVHQIGGGPGRGLAQWGSWVPAYDRFGGNNGLVEFANRKGEPWQDFYTQLEFVMWEFHNTETTGYGKLKAAKNVYEATDAILNYYERPAERHIGPRLSDARKLLDAFQDEMSQVDRFVEAGHGKPDKPDKSGKPDQNQHQHDAPSQVQPEKQPEPVPEVTEVETVDLGQFIDIEGDAASETEVEVEAIPVVEQTEPVEAEEAIPVVEGVADIVDEVETAEPDEVVPVDNIVENVEPAELTEITEYVEIPAEQQGQEETIPSVEEGADTAEPPATTETEELVDYVEIEPEEAEVQPPVVTSSPEVAIPTVPTVPEVTEPATPPTPEVIEPITSPAPEVTEPTMPSIPEVPAPATEAVPTPAVEEYLDVEVPAEPAEETVPSIEVDTPSVESGDTPVVEQNEVPAVDAAQQEAEAKAAEEAKEAERRERERRQEQREQRQEQKAEERLKDKFPVSQEGFTTPAAPHHEITTEYDGYENISGTHTGVDYAIPVGTPLRATKEGVVIRVEENDPVVGGSVWIYHPDENMTSNYQHMVGVDVKPGQRVQLGEHIGKSGNEGSATTGPHLHYMLMEGRQTSITSRSEPDVFAETDDPRQYLPSEGKIDHWQAEH